MAHHPTPAHIGLDLGAVYLTILNEELERRQRDHGHAFLTPAEDAWLKAHGLRRTPHYAHLGAFGDTVGQRRADRPYARA